MGLISKIKNENTLSSNSINEYNKCKNIISNNSIFKQKLDTINILLDKKGVGNFERAHNLLFKPFNHNYSEFPSSTAPYSIINLSKNLILFEHIELENTINKVKPKILLLDKYYKKKTEYDDDEISNPLVSVFLLIIAFISYLVFTNTDFKYGGKVDFGNATFSMILIIISFIIGLLSIIYGVIYSLDIPDYFGNKKNNEIINTNEKEIKRVIRNNSNI